MKTKLLTFTALLIQLALQTLNAQVSQEWLKKYNGPDSLNDGAYSVVADDSGNVFVTGMSIDSLNIIDLVIIKYNYSGARQWLKHKPIGGISIYPTTMTFMAMDKLGNLYITFNITYAISIIKYNSSGVEQWTKRFENSGVSSPSAIAVDDSSNVYITGSLKSVGLAYYITLKYDPDGNLQWDRTYTGSSQYSEAKAIALDDSANVYVTGNSAVTWTDFEYATIKYDSQGNQQWIRSYNGLLGNKFDKATALTVDNEGCIYVTGSSDGYGTRKDFATVKYNSSGEQIWVIRYNGPANGDDIPNSIKADGSGNIYVTGRSEGIGSNFDFATVKYSQRLTVGQIWVRRYNGPGNYWDEPTSMTLDDSGNVYVTGMSMGLNTEYDCATIRYSATGVRDWIRRYNGQANGRDVSNSIVIDNTGSVIIAGWTKGVLTNYDYLTIKYTQQSNEMLALDEKIILKNIPLRFSLSQNYPNPFNPSTNIKFALPKSGFVSLKVYDNLGREVTALVNEQLNAGSYQVDWNASNYASGVYYCKLAAGDFTDTKKMILTK